MTDTVRKLDVVQVERYTPQQVAADLRTIADKIDADPQGHKAGKFVLIRLVDWECEYGAQEGTYDFAIDRSRMRNSEVVALIEAAKHRLIHQVFGINGGGERVEVDPV